ncbi:MAG: phage portal protein, partial [Pseudomonadota bacterium]
AYVEGLLIAETPRELHLLRPDRVTARTDGRGWVEGYDYDTGSNRVNYHTDETTGFCPVLQLSTFHPLDDQYGFAPLEAARMALDVHNAANTWNKALLDNSARPSGALVYAAEGRNLTEDQFDRLKGELEEGYTGASRAGKPMLLEGGLDWKAMGYSPQDMDFVEARNAAARDIALAFGVPPMLLGIPGDNTYSNYAEANRAFARQTLLPMIRRVLASLNHWLGPLYGGDPKLAIDEDKVEGLHTEREALWRRVGEATFLTEDEQRQAVGYSPIGAA